MKKPSPAAAIAKMLRAAAPAGCLEEDPTTPSAECFVLLTRAGRAHVHAVDGTPEKRGGAIPYVQLFVRFEVPAWAQMFVGGTGTLNRYSGKWNHFLPTDPSQAAHLLQFYFGRLWPEAAEIPELAFFAAMGEVIKLRMRETFSLQGRRAWEEGARVRLKVIPSCGHRETWAYCGGCRTDYAGQEAREFWGLAGFFLFELR